MDKWKIWIKKRQGNGFVWNAMQTSDGRVYEFLTRSEAMNVADKLYQNEVYGEKIAVSKHAPE